MSGNLETYVALLRDAAGLFRKYETDHRAKVDKIKANGGRVAGGPSTAEATAKAERNAAMAARIEAAIAGEPQTDMIAWPAELDLESELALILGRPNFMLGTYAHAFRAGGAKIPPKSELEQAFMIHRMVQALYRSGDEKWTDDIQKQLDEAAARAAAKEGDA